MTDVHDLQYTPALRRLHFTTATAAEMAPLLDSQHYLGALKAIRYGFAAWSDDVMVACMAWRWPTARMLPSDGTWLELSRWCLTPAAGRNAGSQMMGWVARWVRANDKRVTTGVSYSDPGRGHTGALYRACGWYSSPTHHELRWRANGVGYPSGNGAWRAGERQGVKQRWLYGFKKDGQR